MTKDNNLVRGEQDANLHNISYGTSEKLREDVLKSISISIVNSDTEKYINNLSESDIKYLEKNISWENNKYWTSASKRTSSILNKLANKLDLLSRSYTINSTNIKFSIKNHFFMESALKQKIEHQRLGRALCCFDDIMENAHVINVEKDIYKGTSRENRNLENVYYLISGYEHNNMIFPVEIIVHDMKHTDAKLKLMYVGEGIKKEAVQHDINTMLTRTAASKIRISDLLRNVNIKDGIILKHIPDAFLTEINRREKEIVLAYDRAKLFVLKEFSKDDQINMKTKLKLQDYFFNGGNESNAKDFLKNINNEFDLNKTNERSLKEDNMNTISYYFAESMEFNELGEYHENLSLEQALNYYNSVPGERLNGIKGIGFTLNDGSMYSGLNYPILVGKEIDVENINYIPHYRDSVEVQNAVVDLIKATEGKVEVLNYDKLNYQPDLIKPVYYPINEEMAKLAKQMNSFDDYIEGSATNSYKKEVDEVYELVKKVIEEKPDRQYQVLKLAEAFSKRYSLWINTYNSIEASVPSIMISGAGNFPVRKKEKQNARRDKHYALLNDYVYKPKVQIESILYGKEVIKSNDVNAINLLKEKVEELQKRQEHMKALNSYYKKNNTVKGFEGISDEQAEKIDKATSESLEKKPYASYKLSNNRQNLKSTQDRLAWLEKMKEKDNTESTNRFFKKVENHDIMRLQLFFDDKPDENVRKILKGNGFVWSVKNGAWQRQLTNNSLYAVNRVIKQLESLYPEENKDVRGEQDNYTPFKKDIDREGEDQNMNIASEEVASSITQENDIEQIIDVPMPSYFSNGRFYINAPYSDRKEVRELGGDWDSKEKKWFFVNPNDKVKFEKWLTDEQKAEPIPVNKQGSIKGIAGSANPDNKYDKMEELVKKLEEGTKDVFSSEKYANYLKTISKLPSYSYNNTILIYLANPNATFVTTFNKMRELYGYQVQAQQKGISILRPNLYSKSTESAIKEIDRYINSDGESRIGQYRFLKDQETGTYNIYKGWNKPGEIFQSNLSRKQLGKFLETYVIDKEFGFPPFLPYTVFDISQAKPIMHKDEKGNEYIDPKAAALQLSLADAVKDHDVYDVAKIYESASKISNVPIYYNDPIGTEKGYYSHDGYINITPTNSPSQALKTLVHELAHSRLHADSSQQLEKTQKEVEAESIAYVVCQYYNIDTSDYSFGYIAEWSRDKELKTLQSSLSTIQKEAHQIISEIDKQLNLIKDLDLSKDNVYLNNPIFDSLLIEKTIEEPIPERSQNQDSSSLQAEEKPNINDPESNADIHGYYFVRFDDNKINIIQITESNGELVIITKNNDGVRIHDFSTRRFDSIIKDGYQKLPNPENKEIEIGLRNSEDIFHIHDDKVQDRPIQSEGNKEVDNTIEITVDNINKTHIVDIEGQFKIMVEVDGKMLPYNNETYNSRSEAINSIPNYDALREEYRLKLKNELDDINVVEPSQNVIVDVYQVKDEHIHEYGFIRYEKLINTYKKTVDKGNYYMAASMSIRNVKNLKELPDNLFYLSNTSDYLNQFALKNANLRTISVSDVIVISTDKDTKAYYVDSIGFKELDDFFQNDESRKIDFDFIEEFRKDSINAITNADKQITHEQASIISWINNEVLPLPNNEADLQRYIDDGKKIVNEIKDAGNLSVQILSNDALIFKKGEILSLKDANKKIAALEKKLKIDGFNEVIPVRINVFDTSSDKEPLIFDEIYTFNEGNQDLIKFMQRTIKDNLSYYQTVIKSGCINGREVDNADIELAEKNIEEANRFKISLQDYINQDTKGKKAIKDNNKDKKQKDQRRDDKNEKETKSKNKVVEYDRC